MAEDIWINPALRRHPEEAAIVGRIVLAYGELELLVAECLAEFLHSTDGARRVMFRTVGETARIRVADALMRFFYVGHGLEGEYGLAMGAMEECIGLRNQYAHCQWADDIRHPGLFFTNLQDPAKSATSFDLWFKHLDVEVLSVQESFVNYTASALQYLKYECRLRTGQIRAHAFPKPAARKPPLWHNPPRLHVPPWLSPEDQQRHTERFREQQEPDPQEPEDKSQASKKERREARMWRAELNLARMRLLKLLNWRRQ